MDESLDATARQLPPGVHAADQGQPGRLRAPTVARLWSAMDRHPGRTLAAVIAFYFAIVTAQASTKLLWCDELITLALARRGSWGAIWQALAAGADPNPPLSHWMVYESMQAFGQSALALRLPAILCVLLAIVSLWAVLRRWVEPGFAALGVLAFMATRGFDYAYDARSYAPLLGFTMAALALWLVACDFPESPRDWPPQNPARLAALTGMAAALALGLSSNYYGVLAFLPIALGQAVRTVRLRRLEPGTWLAMAAAALPLLAFQPLIRHNLAEFGPHAWNRPHAAMIADSYLELVEGVFWPVLGLALYAAWKRRPNPPTASNSHSPKPGAPLFQRSLLKGWGIRAMREPSSDPHPRPLQPHETAALAVLLLYPIFGYLIAVAGHGMISPRCVVPVCCGFGIAAALLSSRIFASSHRAGVILLAAAFFWVAARESACAFVLAQQRAAFFRLRDQVARLPTDRPIVVADSLFVLPLAHYSSEAVRARIVFPIDFAAIHRFESDDSGEQNLWAGRGGVFPIRIAAYDPALFSAPSLIVVARPGGWLAHGLAADGFRIDETQPYPDWHRLGGVFTPMAHPETRILTPTH